MTVRFLLPALIGLAFAGITRAELQFPHAKIVLPAAPGQDQLRGEFPFRNNGREPITITSLNTSCGCTTAALERKTYGPGEAGVVTALFTVGEHTGRQSKTIVVQTNEPKDNVYELILETDVPAVLTLEPRLLVWKHGAALAPQKVKVTFASGKPYRLASANDASGRFVADIAAVPGQAEPDLQIRPIRTDEAVLGVMLLEFVGPEGVKVERSVLMRIIDVP